MAKNTPKKTMTPFEKSLTAIIVLVILAVLALAVFATYGKISDSVRQAAMEEEATAIQNGEKEATVRYTANNAGKTPEEYVEQYGLTLSGDLKETSTLDDMANMMTVENYYKFSDENSGETTDVAAKLAEWGADELGITKDTVWKDVQSKLTLSKYMGEDEFNDLIEQYKSFGYDSSAITADMTMEQANEAVEAMIDKGPVNTPEPAEDAAASDTEAETAAPEAAEDAAE